MKLLACLNVLQLSPLFRLFRERVEAKDVTLEESVRTLSYESELIVQKLRWLLPNVAMPEDKPDDAEEIIPGEETMSAEQILVMEKWEIGTALTSLETKMVGTAHSFSRGHIPAFEGGRQLVVSNIDPDSMRDSLIMIEIRQGGKNRVLLIPRQNFVTHLRDFWREVRRLTAKGAIVRFSRFLGKTKQEAILNFLAFLELIKRRRLRARQSELFGEIEFSATEEGTNKESVL